MRIDNDVIDFPEDIVFLCDALMRPVFDFSLGGWLKCSDVVSWSVVPGAFGSLFLMLFVLLNHDEVFLDFSLEVGGDIRLIVTVGVIDVFFENEWTDIELLLIYCCFLFLVLSRFSLDLVFEGQINALI